MYMHLLQDPKFFRFLSACDDELAEQARRAGCAHCGGRLHRADYPRKPRGGPQEVEEETILRRSFCCEREGCRRRMTPGSLRFLGRRVYFSVVVVLISAMQQGKSSNRLRVLNEHIEISARTLRRWRCWWQSIFAQSGLWRWMRGRLRRPVAPGELPLALLEAFEGGTRSRLLALLHLMLPITVGSPAPVLAP